MSAVLVCGGRTGVQCPQIYAVLDAISNAMSLPKSTLFVHGDAKMTDRFAGAWARSHGFEERKCPIDSTLDGFKDDAPKRRNIRMKQAYSPEIAVCFPGGPGTRHMMSLCLADERMQVLDVEIEWDNFTVWLLKPNSPVTILTQGTFR